MWNCDLQDFEDFHLIRAIIDVTGVLINETPLRIGRGRGEWLGELVDNPIVRLLPDKTPFIPGSSLKGVLRSWAERIARGRGLPCLEPWEIKDGEEIPFTPIEAIFGSQRIASHVTVFDSLPLDKSIRTEVRTGVSIDRVFGTAFPGLLYTVEYVPPHYKWSFRMRIYNIDIVDGEKDSRGVVAGIIQELIGLLKEGVQIGGRKSVGAGLIKLVDAKAEKRAFTSGSLEKVKEVKI